MIHFGMVCAQKNLIDRLAGNDRFAGNRLVCAGGNATSDVPSQNIVSQTTASPLIIHIIFYQELDTFYMDFN